MGFPGDCYRCGDYGHAAAECHELTPAATLKEHLTRLETYKQRLGNWLDGTGKIRWSPDMKTSAIANENRLWAQKQKEMTAK